MTGRSITLFIFGLVMYAIGVVLFWGGLNLPGTSGHDGTLGLYALVLGAAGTAMNYGSVLLHLAPGGPIKAWKIWLNVVSGLISLFTLAWGLIMRTNITFG